jgi:hypothetical protein
MRIKNVKHRLALGWRMVRLDLHSRYATGATGAVRHALPPLLCILIVLAAYALLVPGRAGGRAGLPVALLVVVPLALWSFCADVAVRGAIILREHGYPAKNVVFPLWVTPLVPLAGAALNQLVLFAIVALFAIACGLAPAASAGLFVAAWGISVALTAGLACAAAAVLREWHQAAPAAPVDSVDNLVRSVPVALRKLKREAAELRRQNELLADQVDARLRRLEQLAASPCDTDAALHAAPAAFVPYPDQASIGADTNNANHRTQE